MKQPLQVTFLWHMHQPYYKNIETDKFILPWVRLHAVKDYYDMAAILDKYPKIKQNFNLVPSLLLQIEEYLSGTTDIFMDMSLKPAEALSEEERIFVIFNFFMANWETMIFPYPRYSYLLKKRGENSHPDEIKKIHNLFTLDEIRDLQMWFNLTWIDPMFLEMYPELNRLKKKGENFTEEEKTYVINSHLEIMKLIIPKYREMQEKGRIEISTTPFYHPILPLICNTDTAKVCMPGIPLDFNFSHPEDADMQVKKAVDYYREKFGVAPEGMWPSEGSVSPEVIGILARNNIKWAATDEEILKESLASDGVRHGKDTIYKPYTVNTPEGTVSMVFRNHYLSDLIGFTYQGWNAKEAADHFIKELYNIKNSLDDKAHAVNVILDGENCWEYYANDGHDFLDELYTALSSNDDFETVTINELTKNFPDKPEIKKLFSGSWINHDFYIWIGHEDDRTSWKLLKKVREDLACWQESHGNEKEKLSRAWESVYTAEGSDWNWWYGDDHSSKNDTEFDNLYRLHLINVYKIIGETVPDQLYVPISKAVSSFEISPTMFITPDIDGMDTHFYEWKGAGIVDLSKEGGAMHKVSKMTLKLHYGFDLRALYFRIDMAQKVKNVKGLSVEVRLTDGINTGTVKFIPATGAKETHNVRKDGICFSVNDIFEAAIPFDSLGVIKENKEVTFLVFLYIDGVEKEKVPEKGVIRIQLPDEYFELYNWKV